MAPLQNPLGGGHDTPILQVRTLGCTEEICWRSQPPGTGMQASEVPISGAGGSPMLIFRPAGHLAKASESGLWPRPVCISYSGSLLHMEIPQPSASGKRLWVCSGSGPSSLKVGPFRGGSWWAGSPSGVVSGGVGRAGGAANLAPSAAGQRPFHQHPRASSLLTNGPRLLSLICGAPCNNKTLLKAGMWHE